MFGHHPPYIHSFALTERYVIIPESPFGVDFRDLLIGTPRGQTFLDAFDTRAAKPRFHIIDRTTGHRTAAIEADPFFIYHFANAYETDDTIIVDCVSFDDMRAITGLTIANLRSDDPDLPRGDFVRFRLPLSGERAERERLFRVPVEFPTINYRHHNGRQYRYAYLAATDYRGFPTAIAKIDIEANTVYRWSEPGLYHGEAIFVPAPSPTNEDDGVLLSLALDSRADRSVFLCLDAETLTELGRAVLPHRVPYAFHGQFYDARDPDRSMA